MKFRVKEQNNEGVLLFYLEEDHGHIMLKADDEDGDEWCILTINPGGKLVRHTSVRNDFGIQVDKSGRIVDEK